MGIEGSMVQCSELRPEGYSSCPFSAGGVGAGK